MPAWSLARPEGGARPGDRHADQKPGVVVQRRRHRAEIAVKAGLAVEASRGQGAAAWCGGLQGLAGAASCWRPPEASSTVGAFA